MEEARTIPDEEESKECEEDLTEEDGKIDATRTMPHEVVTRGSATRPTGAEQEAVQRWCHGRRLSYASIKPEPCKKYVFCLLL